MARVLVVDDNLDQVHTLTALLRLEGHTAEGRGDAREIVEGVREFKPDVVVLDLGLPKSADGMRPSKSGKTSGMNLRY